ncbi:hypothetical protein E2I00_013947, partial [Balaenoptera physalus]
KSFPDKAPANGAEQTQKTITPAYNRFTPKPYTSSARPFERKFESPKFSHNLLTSETAHKPDLSSKAPTSPKTLVKAHGSTQPPEFDSGVETFSVHTDNKPKYQVNSISTGPKAVPVSDRPDPCWPRRKHSRATCRLPPEQKDSQGGVEEQAPPAGRPWRHCPREEPIPTTLATEE